ncbi:S4 domain-containing protein YaaA [Bacillus horti]|uniref:S4 domain protein YaaA n=1 Tax=Caldalkalibacillus horti TaxID=77523 RepID=A0ABT9W1J1_9BACI|nr:S4 domain-containing protein YaaA [Bacillus horti]MDQ0167101.1 S4 domain protein YaaA [Bacillus horti]
MIKKIGITPPVITLGQFLKHTGIIDTGGQAKWFLQENIVFVNGEEENRRGRKLALGDQIDIPEVGQFEIVEES